MKPQILSILKGVKPNQNHVNPIMSHLTRTPLLLGPPELRKPTPTAPPQLNSGDPFMDLMVSDYNNTTTTPNVIRPPMGLTENNSPTFLTSGNPCLDFFFHVVPDTPPEYLHKQLPVAWANDALTTLKLIYNLRGVRGTGKSDKEGFYTAAFWLYNHHPKTLACNVASVAAFGYFKDLPEILYRLLQGQDMRKKQKAEWEKIKPYCYKGPGRVRGLMSSRVQQLTGRVATRPRQNAKLLKNKLAAAKLKKKRLRKQLSKEVRAARAAELDKLESEKARELRHEKILEMAKKALARYGQDTDFQFLYEQISDVFAECLKSDMECLKKHERNKISLAAKWCPSLDSSLDKATLLCESIARKVFPQELYPEYQGIEEAHYVYRVRDRLRREVYVPLRKALELPEVYMSAREWNSLPYNRVASVAMKLYKKSFFEHDCERFKKYLEDAKQGKAKVAAGALLPHEIIDSLDDFDGGEVAELQWKRMVEDLLKEGKMKNSIAVSDVSTSMDGIPMEVSVALGLLVSELSEEPWKGKVITFSHEPRLHLIQGDDLSSKIKFVRDMEWGGNTDFQKVFDLLLQVAVNGNLKPEQMIKRVFVFSDMEFDQATGKSRGQFGAYYYGKGTQILGNNSRKEGADKYSWETDYEVIQRKFKEKGYGDVVPQIVFWNLRHSNSTPVTETQPGVALLSGFSKNSLKLFLDNDGQISPDLIMKKAISGKEYHNLVVVD